MTLCTNASSKDSRRFTFRNHRRRRAAAPVHAAANPEPGGARGCAGSACPESATASTSTEGAALRRCFCFVRAGASELFIFSSLNEDEERASVRAAAGSFFGSLATSKTRCKTVSMIGETTVCVIDAALAAIDRTTECGKSETLTPLASAEPIPPDRESVKSPSPGGSPVFAVDGKSSTFFVAAASVGASGDDARSSAGCSFSSPASRASSSSFVSSPPTLSSPSVATLAATP